MPDGDWTREEGPRGGTRWVRGDEVRYSEPAGANSETDEAETRIEDAGIEVADEVLGELDEASRDAVGAAAEAAAEMGARVEEVAHVDNVSDRKASEAMAVWSHEDRALAFNPEYFNEEQVSEWHEDGIIAGSEPEHVAIHEAVHAADDANRDASPGFWWDERGDAPEDISDVAFQNPKEMVAEVGSMLIRGEDVSEEHMKLFDAYDGPEVIGL